MRSVLLALTIVVCLILLGGIADTSPPASAHGTFITQSVLSEQVRFAGDNTIISRIVTGQVTGTLTGPWVVTVNILRYPTGDQTFQALATCSPCTALGQSGTAVLRVEGEGDPFSLHGHFVVLSGADGLANLYGQGTFVGAEGPVNVDGTYAGALAFR